MIINTKLILFLNLFLLLLLTACTKAAKPQGEVYTLDECKQELLEAEDYSHKKSVDQLIN